MFDPNGLTFGQVSSFIKDYTIVGVLIAAAWKARGISDKVTLFIDDIKLFMKRSEQHMQSVEDTLNIATTNHLSHIQEDLRTMSGRKADATELKGSAGSK